MGYNTSFSIKAKPKIIQDLITSNEDAGDALNKDGTTKEEVKWYDYNKDLLKFSKKYPEEVIQLDGTGEDGELYRSYYLNGKVQDAEPEIVYPEFDKTKLI